MITFCIAFVCLILGYLIYGRYVSKYVFKPDNRPTPAMVRPDGVDYVPMPTWRVFLIQFLNIDGAGPIFGAIMGAWYGPVAYLWIVLGCIFAGGVHDYFCGMLSVRNGGHGLPELAGKYMGRTMRTLTLVFTAVMLLFVGVVFIYSPASIINNMVGAPTTESMMPITIIISIIFLYYLLATMLPIDKIIGRIYPLFAAATLFMALGLLISLIIKVPAVPELWTPYGDGQGYNESFELLGVTPFIAKNPIVPCLFITIACGACSGFHSTQSPLMARCIKHEKHGRLIFYGSMITEGFVALIWATVSMYFFYYGGWREVVSPEVVDKFMAQVGQEKGKSLIQYFAPPMVVTSICNGWLGVLGGILAILGVVAAPLTSGDTALRSCRLSIADFLHIEQRSISKRLMLSLPIFGAALALLIWQLASPDGFNIIWQYFGWSNQALAVITLWTVTIYLTKSKKNYFISLVPAVFMTSICSTFFIISPLMLNLTNQLIPWAITTVTILSFALFYWWKRRLVV